MKKDPKNQAKLDELIRQTLKDDLPAETEMRMQAQLDAMREKMLLSQRQHLSKTDKTPAFRLPFRQEVLAWAAFIMVILGSFLYINGSQSALTGNISALGTAVSVMDRMNRSQSMECSLRLVSHDAISRTYRIQWRAPNITRVQIYNPAPMLLKTLWITPDNITITNDQTKQQNRIGSIDQITDRDFLAAMNYISPQSLVKKINGPWRLKQYQYRKDCEAGEFSIASSDEDYPLHLTVDLCTYLPIQIQKISPVSRGTSASSDSLMDIHLEWNTGIFTDSPPWELTGNNIGFNKQ